MPIWLCSQQKRKHLDSRWTPENHLDSGGVHLEYVGQGKVLENPIFAILTKIHLYKHYVQIAMIQRVFEQALFSRITVQMHKDLKIGKRPWNWQQYAS